MQYCVMQYYVKLLRIHRTLRYFVVSDREIKNRKIAKKLKFFSSYPWCYPLVTGRRL